MEQAGGWLVASGKAFAQGGARRRRLDVGSEAKKPSERGIKLASDYKLPFGGPNLCGEG